MPERADTLEVIGLIMFAPLLYSMVSLYGFNGAAPARARRAASIRLACNASPCFNGAAPARARRGCPKQHLARNISCFNGAAPARARREGSARGIYDGDHGFNGAAPARARRAGLIIAAKDVRSLLLQWGRARAGAER